MTDAGGGGGGGGGGRPPGRVRRGGVGRLRSKLTVYRSNLSRAALVDITAAYKKYENINKKVAKPRTSGVYTALSEAT